MAGMKALLSTEGIDTWDDETVKLHGIAPTLKLASLFTETAKAGTYTADIDTPAGYSVLKVTQQTAVAWNNNSTAVCKVGIKGGDDNCFLDAVDVKTVLLSESNAAANTAAKAHQIVSRTTCATVEGVIETAGSTGSNGRTYLIVEFIPDANVGAATKVET